MAIKEDDLDREIKEERALILQVEKKFDRIIDSGCSHHMNGDENKFVKFRNHDGGIVRVGNNQPIISREYDLLLLMERLTLMMFILLMD